MMNHCLFCKIASGEIPSEKIYEDENVLAFLDIQPRSPGHTMIIPKNHAANLSELPDSNNKAVQIIYEDDDVFAAVKPAGVVMHADSHHPKGSFLEMVCTLRPTAQLLHRLDKDTSGVALFAKTDAAASYYKKLFKDTLIQKTYLALVVGTFTKKKGIIALPIG